ncbi:hypothetical protein AB5I41_25845 [Sphingomonas sp. MMS24-JH45]
MDRRRLRRGHARLRRAQQARGQALPWYSKGKIVSDGQLALYAKGRVKGSWLATIAYDSDRMRDRTRGLLGTIDPDRYYTVYGDNTPRLRRRDRAQALPAAGAPRPRRAVRRFRDRHDRQPARRFSRTLNGAKVAWSGNRVAVTAFAAQTDKDFYARDKIQGTASSSPSVSAPRHHPNSDSCGCRGARPLPLRGDRLLDRDDPPHRL